MAKRKSDFYTNEELEKIKAQWRIDKARIDANLAFGYQHDKDSEYMQCLHNSNLRALFKHAARIRRWLIEEEPIWLYPEEYEKVTKVYERIMKDGYYEKSKLEEKTIRAWFGKIVSRQSFQRFKKY